QRIGDSGNRRATYPWAGVSGTQRDSSCGRGQFRTRVVGAHSGDSSEHGVVGAHSGDSSEHGWSVHTAGTVQNTGGQCKQRRQFRTRTLSGRRLQTGTTSGQHSMDDQRSADSFQGCVATDSVRGPSAAALRALSSRQGAGALLH
ncbi:unnamed protein product, partial [Staurois parvus]